MWCRPTHARTDRGVPGGLRPNESFGGGAQPKNTASAAAHWRAFGAPSMGCASHKGMLSWSSPLACVSGFAHALLVLCSLHPNPEHMKPTNQHNVPVRPLIHWKESVHFPSYEQLSINHQHYSDLAPSPTPVYMRQTCACTVLRIPNHCIPLGGPTAPRGLSVIRRDLRVGLA